MSDIEAIYNKLAPEYDSRYRLTKHYVEEAIISGLLCDVLDVGSIESILDFGCGTGNMITVGELPASSYLGVDVSLGMLKVARENYPDYQFQHRDIVNKNIGKFELILSIFGQANYIGIEDWANTIKLNKANDGKFISVMYSNCYKPEYVNGEAKQYTAQQVSDCLLDYGLKHNLVGFSFNIKSEEEMDFMQMHNIQQFAMNTGRLDGCNYWLVWG